VGSQISGIIQTLSADFNTRVTNGQVVAQLDPATYKENAASTEGTDNATTLAFRSASVSDARENAASCALQYGHHEPR